MTPIELFDYDINGYVYIERAVESDYLNQINNRMDEIEDQVWGNGVIWESKKILSHDLMTSLTGNLNFCR